MTNKEIKIYDQMLNLIISKAEAGQKTIDMIKLLAKMRSAYQTQEVK